MRWPRLTIGLKLGTAAALAASTGCAKLVVHKIPVESRIEGHDHVDGFRYYLSRPYVVVKKPVLVSTQQSLVAAVEEVSPAPTGQASTSSLRARKIRFLDGPRAGETVSLADLEVTSPGSSAVRRLSDNEVASLQGAIRDEAVQRTAAAAPAAAQTAQDSGGNALQSNTANLGDVQFKTFSGYDPTKPPGKTVNLTGDIDVVFLPDLDEQYAMKSKNFLSKSSFAAVFKDGWQLTDVQAEHDSTPVAIELLNTISKAVNAAQTIASAGLTSGGGGTPATKDFSGSLSKKTQDGKDISLYYLTTNTYIKPGIYRINKPWEAEAGAPMPVGCGLLAKLGLTQVIEVQLNLIAKPGS